LNLLVDTHVVLWAATAPRRLSRAARRLLDDPTHALHFSAASLWEIVIKQGLGREDFDVDARRLWRALPDNGWRELPVLGAHVLAVATLPPLHRDPFDRLLLAQAGVEGWSPVTADEAVSAYPGDVIRV
jgi:PIN domain nuclease of toxin-antitoxin system